MKFSFITYLIGLVTISAVISTIGTGCAQIGMPTGGTKDTIPPTLVSANPTNKAINFTGNKITLTFNEYVEVQEAQANVLVSPLPKKNPEINYKLKTVTVKLKDTLQPNTTYSINFGNAIKDINEGNPLSNFTYVFSTGATIDSLTLMGKVILAETGKTDSTFIAMLYRNANDSSVQKTKPDYIAKLNGNGSFTFVNLPAGNFKLYALKDGDGGKTYNSKIEPFAFLNTDISTEAVNDTILLNAFVQEKEDKKTATPTKSADKKLRYTLPQDATQDLLTPYIIQFNKPLKKAELNKLLLLDTNYKAITTATFSLDSTSKVLSIINKWKEAEQYKFILNKDDFADSANVSLAKTDTIKITAKKESDYGNVVLRFKNIDVAKNQVLQFVVGDEIKQSFAITAAEWSNKLFTPGEYELRILYDINKNGKWDTGNYNKKQQPEKVITLPQKLSIKANWDNERDIEL
ncbi:MAG: Ig-like domain-containing protein [Chitinophagaceae bacterium]|nr:Ig-like domain-containing protein [Chitinophagaceae bacterium]